MSPTDHDTDVLDRSDPEELAAELYRLSGKHAEKTGRITEAGLIREAAEMIRTLAERAGLI